MTKQRQITLEQARRIGDLLYLDWDQVDLEQFRQGLIGYYSMDADYRGVLLAGRAVLAHMEQFPDYLVRLARLRAETKMFPEGIRKQPGSGAVADPRIQQR